MSDQRSLFESAVVDRLKENGFLEIEIRTECLVRCEDGYQDEVINAGWHYWNAAIAATPSTTSNLEGDEFLHRLIENAFSWGKQDCNYLNPKHMDRFIAATKNGMPPEAAAAWIADGSTVSSHAAPAPQMMTKQLEWSPEECPDAKCILGHYVINPFYRMVELIIGYGKMSMITSARIQLNGQATVEDLKAAAQSDFNARITSALAPTPAPHVTAPDLTNEQREITLLRIIEAMGGLTDSSESRHSWLNWFCSDEIHNLQDDTFNRCHEKGWLWTTHNSDWDTSTTTLTGAGRAALATSEDQP